MATKRNPKKEAQAKAAAASAQAPVAASTPPADVATKPSVAVKETASAPRKPKPRPKLKAKDKEKAVAVSAAVTSLSGTSPSGKIPKQPEAAPLEAQSVALDAGSDKIESPTEKKTGKPSVAKKKVAQPKASKNPKAEASKTSNSDEAPGKPKKKLPWFRYSVLVLLAAVVLVVAVFSWDRWFRYDDAQGFQGEWLIDNSTKTVLIDENRIQLTDEVAYDYFIDPSSKTISFTFGKLSGSGRYRFSEDRMQLVIVEGATNSFFSTLFEDIAWKWDALVRAVQGQEPVQPALGESILVFERPSAAGVSAGELPGDESAATPEPTPEPAPEPEPTPEPDAPAEDSTGEANPSSSDSSAASEPGANGAADAAGNAALPRDLFDVSDAGA